MEEGSNEKHSLIRRIQDLERERDELRKDIEQLCLHPSGPSFLGVATRMHLQRIAGLEQEIENLKHEVALCKRECQNLREELSEAYKIKSHLAHLYNQEVAKNKEIEKQVKFFQGCVAGAFAERDHAIMEMENAKESEQIIADKLKLFHYRLEELESASAELWRDNTASQIELLSCKEKMLSCVEVVSKFYEIRRKATGNFTHENLDSICSCLLNDPPDIWNFDQGRNTSTLKYIASLESKLDYFRKSMENFQNKLRMGLEIEQHLKRRIHILENQIKVLNDTIRIGISGLRNFQNELSFNIACVLKEEQDQRELDFAELKEKMATLSETTELKMGTYWKDHRVVEECKDLHVTGDDDCGPVENVTPCIGTTTSDTLPETSDALALALKEMVTPCVGTTISDTLCETSDALALPLKEKVTPCIGATTSDTLSETSDALALALKEKVDALLLLSQQEERHFLERETNISLQIKMDELQKNLFQVTDEKVKALMELAELKKQLQLQQENCKCGMKHCHTSVDGGSKLLPSQLQDGRLKGILKRTYLRRWIGHDIAENESSVQLDPDVCVPDNSKKNAFAGVSRNTKNVTGEETVNITGDEAVNITGKETPTHVE